MKKILCIISIAGLFVLSSCGENTKTIKQVVDTVKNDYSVKDTNQLKPDTNTAKVILPATNEFSKIDSNTYSFSFGDDGSEGNEGKAYYENGEIKKITFAVFGEAGQFRMTYSFSKKNSIILCEKDFSYPRGIDSVSTTKDMQLDIDTCLSIDYNGNETASGKKDSTSMGEGYLSEIKKIVPFKIDK